MICKKCGNKLIEGIDICPFCGEVAQKEEPQNLDVKHLFSDLNNLKINEDNIDSKIQEENSIDNFDENLAVTQDLSNLKLEVEALGLNDTNDKEEKDLISNQVEINTNKPEETEHQSNVNDEIPSINEIIENIEPMNNDDFEIEFPKTEINFDTIDMSNYIDKDDNNKIDETNISSEETDKNDSLDIESLNNKIEVFTPEAPKDEIRILPDKDLYEDSKDINNNINNDVPNLQDLIENINEIPIENTKEENNIPTNESEISQNENINTYDLIQDLKSIKIEGISPILETEEKKEDTIIDNDSPIKNDYLIKTEIPNISSEATLNYNIENQSDNLNVDISKEENIESFDNNTLENQEVQNINTDQKKNINEENNLDFNSIDNDNLHLKENKLRLENKEETVYINENLNLDSNESVIIPPVQELTPTNIELLNSNSTMPTNEEVKQENNDIPKKNKNFNITILFICMIVLGVAVALVVSYIFNM